jgi:two-component system, chemotaxis family, sensor kinase CheA
MDEVFLKFRDKFIDEANGLLDKLEKDLLELESNPGNKELIESAFRAMHTLKGVSGMYGFNYISDYTHHFESIFQRVREGKLKLNKEINDVTFTSIDHIRKLLSDEKLSNQSLKQEYYELLEKVKNICTRPEENTTEIETVKPSHPISPDKVSIWHIILKTNEQMFFRGISILNIFSELSALGEFNITRFEQENNNIDIWDIIFKTQATEDQIKDVFIFIEDECSIVQLPNLDDIDKKKSTKKSGNKKISFNEYAETIGNMERPVTEIKENGHIPEHNEIKRNSKRISVDSSKLDHLMYLVSELITVNSQLSISTQSPQFNTIRANLEKVDSLSKQFRNNALDIRLVPLGETVIRFQRLIRDLSKNLNKEVLFVTNGTDTELDKSTIDQLTEPLMHIIRNCIDHGIETPEKRLAKGKTASGTITLSSFYSGNNVYIKIADDGTGINHEKVRQKAVDLNIIKPSDKPTKKEIYDLIFLPGFSTAQSLTEVSGRGVGMDVVKKRIIDLRGEIIVDSEEGIGTSFTLKLQQSLTIIDTLLFTINSDHYIVPLSDIELCEQIRSEDIDKRRNTTTIEFNNKLIPFIDLRMLFSIGGKYGAKTKLIIVKSNDKPFALLADRIIGEHQAVLKPLGKAFTNQQYISAASQLGDGNIAFMLDIAKLGINYTN